MDWKTTEFGELQSGQRSFVTDLILSTPVHCPVNPGDKEQGHAEVIMS